MPLIAVNLSEKVLQQIRVLIDTGRYANLESFIEIGAFNQLASAGSSPDEILKRGHRKVATNSPDKNSDEVAPPPKPPARAAAANGAKKHSRADKATAVVVVEPVSEEEAKEVFCRSRPDQG